MPKLLILQFGPAISIGAGKTTLANTIQYVLKKYYDFDIFLADGDDEPNARNNDFLKAAKEKLQRESKDPAAPLEIYESFCDAGYTAMLKSRLFNPLPTTIINGDWARRIPRIKDVLKQMVNGTFPQQVKPCEIKAIFCYCPYQTQRDRMIERNHPRDEEYIKDNSKCWGDFSKRYEKDWETIQTLRDCGIQTTIVDMSKNFPTKIVKRPIGLSNNVTILDYDGDYHVRTFLNHLIGKLFGLSLSSKQLALFFSSHLEARRLAINQDAEQKTDPALPNPDGNAKQLDSAEPEPTFKRTRRQCG